MKKLDGNKKICLLGLILLIVAGIVVVALRGFNVSLILRQHESISLFVGKEVKLNEIDGICKEIFKDKEYVIRGVELFDDSFNVNAESITNEEKQALVDKVNEKFGKDFKAENINIKNNPNIRLRDIIRPYVKPVVISALLILVYLVIRFKEEKVLNILGKIAGVVVLTELVLLSIIAVLRIPLTPILIDVLVAIAVVELLVYIYKLENKPFVAEEKK